jgi:hypothetical protein
MIKSDLYNIPISFILNILRRKDSFIFNDNEYYYFIHPRSWNSERVAEIPIILDYLIQDMSGKRKILEFGNVLSQFIKCERKWDILDKYSEGEGVIHEDIIDFKPKEKYDLIISISTLEHVGLNENVEVVGHDFTLYDNIKTEKAIKNIKENCLKPNGRMVFTIPLGYNLALDNSLFYDKMGFDKLIYMKRISKNNLWKEIKFEEIDYSLNCYGHPFPCANYICVGIYQN